MKGFIIVLLCTVGHQCFAQFWEVISHPNSHKKAIQLDTLNHTDYIYTEVSELSERKAYVSQGDLYAYVDEAGVELTPYVFAEANNFIKGYAIVGDSFNQSVLNAQMQLILPFEYARARLPIYGLIVVQSHEGLWGLFDTTGIQRLPFVYYLPPLILNLEQIIVRKEEEYGVVNDCNEVVFNTGYQYISPGGLGYKSGKYLRLF